MDILRYVMRAHAAVVLLPLMLVSIAFAIRTRFWVPRYVHVMALASAAIGVGSVLYLDSLLPMEPGARGRLLLMLGLMFPAVVYVAFIVYGGQRAAYSAASTECAECGSHVPPLRRSENPMHHRCPSCGAYVGHGTGR